MKNVTILFVLVFAFFNSGCGIELPAGMTEIHSVAAANSGRAAVVGSQTGGKDARIEERSERFVISKGWGSWGFSGMTEEVWRPLGHGQKGDKLFYRGEELLVFRRGDVYRVSDNMKLTNFGDVLDAAAAGTGGLLVVRPWEKAQYAIFSIEHDSQLQKVAVRSDFIAGTLGLHNFGKGPELYWAEARSTGRAYILRHTTAGGVEILYRPKHRPTGKHSIGALYCKKHHERVLVWSAPPNIYFWSRECGRRGRRREGRDREYSMGVVSENGQCAAGWNVAEKTFDSGSVECEQ